MYPLKQQCLSLRLSLVSCFLVYILSYFLYHHVCVMEWKGCNFKSYSLLKLQPTKNDRGGCAVLTKHPQSFRCRFLIVWIPPQTPNDPLTGSHQITKIFSQSPNKEKIYFYLLHAPSLYFLRSITSLSERLISRIFK